MLTVLADPRHLRVVMPEIGITVEGGRGATWAARAYLRLKLIELPLPSIVNVVRLAEDALMRPFDGSCVRRLAWVM